jgi:hypothetical protein
LPQKVAGCYLVHLEPWTPTASLGRDTVFIRVPARIQLMADTGTTLFEQGRWLVRAAPGEPRTRHRFSIFHPIGSDSIEAVWSTGFSGVRMRLDHTSVPLTGRAFTFWDFPRAQQVADVRLEPTSCRVPLPNKPLLQPPQTLVEGAHALRHVRHQ